MPLVSAPLIGAPFSAPIDKGAILSASPGSPKVASDIANIAYATFAVAEIAGLEAILCQWPPGKATRVIP